MSVLVNKDTRVITHGITGGKGDAASKKAFLRECGVSVADSPAEMAKALLRIWQP